ncbi:uncharacterized protein LOC143861770 isoform X2 [Tasmannia lanceolata]|uniref:uncharacterized protein LOC143861770 isoform X2 n=1 Tax=Tasmannia lanceolata TaxID=3420 RepID=UPI004062C9F0
MEEAPVAKNWLENLANGGARQVKDLGDGKPREFKALDAVALKGLQILRAEKGLLFCKFVVPNHLSDKDGNWSAGAIATLIDDVGSLTVFSFFNQIKVSVDFVISYFSTVKINEEVEIEAKVLGPQGKLSSMMVEIRKKVTGELVALGKQWMSAVKPEGVDRKSKL